MGKVFVINNPFYFICFCKLFFNISNNSTLYLVSMATKFNGFFSYYARQHSNHTFFKDNLKTSIGKLFVMYNIWILSNNFQDVLVSTF